MADDPFAPIQVDPVTLMIGKFKAWQIAFDMDPTLFTVAYTFRSTTPVTVTGVSNGDGTWTFTLSSTASATLDAGRLSVDVILTRIADNEEVIKNSFFVNVFATDADRRSHAQIMVDKIESLLEGRAADDIQNYSIKNRSLTKLTVQELTNWRNYYLGELGRERNAFTGKQRAPNALTVGFK